MATTRPHKGEGHRGRLRERFLSSGLDGFHDYEVVELLLTLATPRVDCKETAKAALLRFKTLQGVLSASAEELKQVKGIGPRNLLGLKLVKAVAERFLEQKLISRDPINNSQDLFDFLYLTLREKRRESFMAIFLDAKNRVIGSDILFEGTISSGSVYPREVVRAALNRHAAALIFAHNHPSGNPKPSQSDVLLTRQLIFACRSVGVRVHEHLVIGDGRYYSFADNGHIIEMNREFEDQHKAVPAESAENDGQEL